jgi:hypothetical protein
MRRSTIAAVGLAGLSLALSLYDAAMDSIPRRSGVTGPDVSGPETIVVALFIFGTPLLGALIASRRPRNPTGWLFLMMVLGISTTFASDNFVRHAPPDLATAWIGTIGSSLGNIGFLALFLLLMSFPTGRLPSRRWRLVPAVAVVGVATSSAYSLFTPGSPVSPPVPDVINPLGQPGWEPVLRALMGVGQVSFLIMIVGSFAILIVRFRRSRDAERQQLKWFVWAASVFVGLFLGDLAIAVTVPGAAIGDVLWVLALSSLALLPTAAAIAVLRYQLFDIDLLINRTLVYGALTAVLGSVYVATVFAIEGLLSNVTGSGNLAVAASTLAVFALFSPVRARIQRAVDRRFYRSRYDAQRIVESFARRLRDEVDLDLLTRELILAVGTTVQPKAFSIWIRER